KSYFKAMGALVPEDMSFTGRSRQPPRDVVNAALSFGYTLLLGECEVAVYAAGLEPGLGILHAPQDRRPSLALDLMEEFRPLVVDQVVLTMVRGRQLRPEHGRPDKEGGSGVYLTKAGREALVAAYERRMLTETRGALPDFSGTL